MASAICTRVIQSAIDACDDSIKSDVANIYQARDETLARCYSIQGYADMERNEQRLVYDKVHDMVMARSEQKED